MENECNKNLKILIVRLSAIGDTIHSIPVACAIKDSFPSSCIGWIVEDRSKDLLINNPCVDKVFVMPKSKWKKQGLSLKTIREIIDFVRKIRKEKFDVALDLQELFKSSLLMFLSGAKRRIGHDKTREFAYLFANEKLPYHDTFDPEKPIIERYMEFVGALGADVNKIRFYLPPSSKETVEKLDELLTGVDKSKPIVVLNPSTIWPTKHWIEEYWAEVADKLSDRANIIFSGAESDKELINRIIARTEKKDCISLAGKTSIIELVELFRRSKIVVAPDTGPAHIAAAAGCQVITVFGSTSYKRSAPFGCEDNAISMGIKCQPCFNRKCARKGEENMECMKKITPDIILKKVTSIL